MSDRMSAEIWIGGKVAASLVPALCRAITHERVSLEWGDASFCPTSAEELEACRKNDDGSSSQVRQNVFTAVAAGLSRWQWPNVALSSTLEEAA